MIDLKSDVLKIYTDLLQYIYIFFGLVCCTEISIDCKIIAVTSHKLKSNDFLERLLVSFSTIHGRHFTGTKRELEVEKGCL